MEDCLSEFNPLNSNSVLLFYRCEEVQERQQHLKERHRRYAQALDNKMREAEAKRQQQEQEEKKR